MLNLRQIIHHFFRKEELEQVSEAELRKFVELYPYSAAGHLLLAKKLKETGDKRAFEKEISSTALYFNNPVWLEWLMKEEEKHDTLDYRESSGMEQRQNPAAGHGDQQQEEIAPAESVADNTADHVQDQSLSGIEPGSHHEQEYNEPADLATQSEEYAQHPETGTAGEKPSEFTEDIIPDKTAENLQEPVEDTFHDHTITNFEEKIPATEETYEEPSNVEEYALNAGTETYPDPVIPGKENTVEIEQAEAGIQDAIVEGDHRSFMEPADPDQPSAQNLHEASVPYEAETPGVESLSGNPEDQNAGHDYSSNMPEPETAVQDYNETSDTIEEIRPVSGIEEYTAHDPGTAEHNEPGREKETAPAIAETGEEAATPGNQFPGNENTTASDQDFPPAKEEVPVNQPVEKEDRFLSDILEERAESTALPLAQSGSAGGTLANEEATAPLGEQVSAEASTNVNGSHQDENAPERTAGPDPMAADRTIQAAENLQDGLSFEPYHTVDYFASQGIRLKQDELNRDKLGQQLKSFTEWLRSMKKVPGQMQATDLDDTTQLTIRRFAEHSVKEKEVLTEAMAEVWAKQGNRQKAIAIYQKLSLQNPDKSAYFAAKIDQLNAL
jgi:hypothetical protein